MALFIDRKFISLISVKLERFTQKSDYLWNFRCPHCGDSKKNKLKSRGYVYRKKNDLFFSCHNCGISSSFGNFLKLVDVALYKEYQLERYKNDNHSNIKQPDFSMAKTKPVFNITKKINLPTIESLLNIHPAKQYIVNRKIPSHLLSELFFAEDFLSFIDELIPRHGKNLMRKDPRIVLPFYDDKNILLGVQGRAIKPSELKYITIKIDEESRKVFGLNKVDFSKRIYIVEGPLDSLFLNNSLAMMDAALHKAITIVGDYDYVFITDNEPRNKEIVKHMKTAIDLDKNVCVWPKHIKEKDINDMILSGYSTSEIMCLIDNNTHKGLRAKLEFEQWKKI